MAADDEEATPNKNASADAGDFDSAHLGGGGITDEEGAASKENLLAAVATPAEAITVGVVAVDAPKENAAARADDASPFFSSNPFVSGDGAFATVYGRGGNITDEEGGAPKEKLIADVAAPAESLTAGVVAANRPKEKEAAGADKELSFFYSKPLSQETDPVPPLMADE